MTTRSPLVLPQPIVTRPAAEADSAALRRLWQLFRYDMSTVTQALPDPQGDFRSERLEHAIAGTPGWQAWLTSAGAHPVAFAVAPALDTPEHILTSFFVLAPARRRQLGRDLAHTVLTANPGRWAIAFRDANTAGAAFWPTVAASLDPHWTSTHEPVPGRHDLPPDHWVRFTVPVSRSPL